MTTGLSGLQLYSLYLMSGFYVLAGILHWIFPRFYLKIIPPYMPWHKTLNITSGLAEVILGLAILIEPIRELAAWGIILLLIAVFPANIYHLQTRGAGMKIPMWVLWVRLPLQLVFILWAYSFT